MESDQDRQLARSHGGDVAAVLKPSESEWARVAELPKLSPRQLQIVICLFHDAKEPAIAEQLCISPHTVHTYLNRLYRKLRVSSRVELVLRVVAEFDAPSASEVSPEQASPEQASPE